MTQGTKPRVLLRKQGWAVIPLPATLLCCPGASSAIWPTRPREPGLPPPPICHRGHTGDVAPVLFAYAVGFSGICLFLVIPGSVSMWPPSRSRLPFLCCHGLLSLLHLKSSPGGRIACFCVCLSSPAKGTCLTHP